VSFDWVLNSKANFGILEGFLSELLKDDIKNPLQECSHD
jgi:hypothetical protein